MIPGSGLYSYPFASNPWLTPKSMMEAQLLHIECRPGEQWRLVGCIPLANDHIALGLRNLNGQTYGEGVLECVAHALSEDGACFGWQLHTVGTLNKRGDGTLYAVVTVVREKHSMDTGTVSEKSYKGGVEAVKEWDLMGTDN